MKSVLLALVLIVSFTSANSHACAPVEAQFIGKITNVRSDGILCEYQVGQYSMYNESGVCGLSDSDASKVWLTDATCLLNVGDAASGILSVDAQGHVLHH